MCRDLTLSLCLIGSVCSACIAQHGVAALPSDCVRIESQRFPEVQRAPSFYSRVENIYVRPLQHSWTQVRLNEAQKVRKFVFARLISSGLEPGIAVQTSWSWQTVGPLSQAPLSSRPRTSPLNNFSYGSCCKLCKE